MSFLHPVKAKRSFLALDASLEQCDGKPAGFLDQLAADWSPDDRLLLHLVVLAEQADPKVQMAVTGLLKRHVTRGAILPEAAASRLFDLLPALGRWESKLHALQMLPCLPILAPRADGLRGFLADALRDQNKFVRAWAYAGWHRLASLHPGYHAEAAALLARAGREEAPSVRARLRRLPPLREST